MFDVYWQNPLRIVLEYINHHFNSHVYEKYINA